MPLAYFSLLWIYAAVNAAILIFAGAFCLLVIVNRDPDRRTAFRATTFLVLASGVFWIAIYVFGDFIAFVK
jgi:hypothetical protein